MAGTSSNSSSNQSTSASQSSTQVLDYPERAFLDSIAQYAGQVGQNVYNWAQDAYAKNSSLTDANISNYLNTAQQSSGMAQNDLSRYQQKFQPEEDQLLRDANEYASPERVKNEMGQAESGQMQGNEAALANHKRDLQAYGIDPSSGRYAGLDEAARVSGAAAAVGAAQQARQNTEAVGRDLRNQAIQVGSQYPGRTINALNTTLQGIAGAENAGLANANTGVSLMGAANPFLGTASSYKPITGTFSNSASQSSGVSSGSSQTTDPAAQPKDQSQPQQQSGSGSGSGGSGGGTSGSSSGTSSSGSSGSGSGDGSDPFTSGSGVDYGDGSNDWTTGGGLPADWSGSDGSFAPGDAADFTDFSSGGMGAQDSYQDYGQYGGSYTGDSGGGGGDYAEGGTIDDDDTGAIPEDGGAIPPSASPSHGAVTDDVQAQLPSGKQINVNAREFVIPEDVARWKGEEFFQKLIAQSRQARVTAPAKPAMGQPQHA